MAARAMREMTDWADEFYPDQDDYWVGVLGVLGIEQQVRVVGSTVSGD